MKTLSRAFLVLGSLLAVITLTASMPLYDSAVLRWANVPAAEFPLTAQFHYANNVVVHTETTNGVFQYPDPAFGAFLGVTINNQFVALGQTKAITTSSSVGIGVIDVTCNIGTCPGTDFENSAFVYGNWRGYELYRPG